MKFFVTGGAGFIGSILVERLLEKRTNAVTVYDNLSSGNYKNIKKFVDNKNYSFVKGDILNPKQLKEAMKGHDFVYHFAANPDIRLGLKKPRFDFKINTVGTLNVLDAMVASKINKVAFASTSTVYGIASKIPTPEDYGPCLPTSLYGASKLACEGFISSYSEIYGIKAWIFRFANITGAPSTHGIIFDFYRKIEKNPNKLEVLGDGNQSKSYLTHKMLVNAMEWVIKKTKNQNQKVFLYNVGNDDRVSVKEITKIFLKENNLKSKVRYTGGKGGWKGDVPVMELDVKKIKKIGWSPDKSSKECIVESIKENR